MYRMLREPADLDRPIEHQCKFCHNPDARHTIDYPMNKLQIGASDGPFTLYTYAAFCDDCGGLTVAALKGNFPELDEQFETGISYG